MKSLLISISFLILAFKADAQHDDLLRLRDLSAQHSEAALNEMKVLIENVKLPLALSDGYRGLALLISAKVSYSPFNKLKYFYAGTRMLDESVKADVTSIELRYLRFCVQTNVPRFLNYSGYIKEDKEYMLKNWNKLTDADLKDRIRKLMLRSQYCNDFERKQFAHG